MSFLAQMLLRTMGRLARPAATGTAALLLAFPGVSLATVYYVSPSGNDSNNGTTPTSAFATIGKANSRVAAGDVVYLANGSYTQYPNPAVSGTAAQRISYIGNVQSPASVPVSGGTDLVRNYVTIKGLYLTEGISINGTRDSVDRCQVGGGWSGIAVGVDCSMSKCSVSSQRFWIMGSATDTTQRALRDTVSDCTFYLSPYDQGGHTMRWTGLRECVLQRNRFIINIAAAAVGASCTKLFATKYCRFVDNFWDITNNCLNGCDEAGWFVNRDNTQSNTWVRDTIIMRGPGPVQFFGSCSGSYPATVMNNTYDHCVFKMDGPLAYNYAIYYQDRARWDTWTNCVVSSSGGGMNINGAVDGPMIIDHCVFASYGGRAAVWLFTYPNMYTDRFAFRSNILVAKTSVTALDNTDPTVVKGHLVSNYNVFYGSGTKTQSINSGGTLSGPGVGTAWCTAALADSNSVFGAPKFADESSVLSFDAHLMAGSAAIGAGVGGSDAGAFAYGGADVTPPANVTNLASPVVNDQMVQLTWTAPGDDGGLGTAALYDLRWSSAPITSANFAAATAVAGLSVPLVAGTSQSTVVTGLTPGTQYYFALKSSDEAGNWSGLSNVLAVTTTSTDRLAPAAVQDLKADP